MDSPDSSFGHLSVSSPKVLTRELVVVNRRQASTVTIVFRNNCYRPQRSWGKVIFSQACVKKSRILSTGVCLGRHTHWEQTPPPGADTPLGSRLPWEQTPPGQTPSPPSSACWEIRATSGRYVSYLNTYLLICECGTRLTVP